MSVVPTYYYCGLVVSFCCFFVLVFVFGWGCGGEGGREREEGVSE